MTSTPTPEPGERRWVCHKPGWMGPCSPQSTHHNGFDWGCGWIYFPAPSTPGEGTPARDVADAVDSCPGCEAPLWPDDLTSCWNCGQTLIDYGPKFRTPPPGEGAGRPLPEFQMVACADHMLTGHRWRCRACRREVERQFQECCEEMWRLQRITPAPPASPADDVPDADAVAFQNGYRIGVRVGSEHHGPCRGLPPASPVPPTPTPCPYIVTGGEGTSYCSLAERSAMHAAAPPSTPADPRPTDPTGSEA